ncbi:ABC transporter permease [Leptolyngbya sp. CCY15150]|uniref:ABC transporter permease subunit n=1 Tax=Leptolyngbya sp. CCY15150 TaxID=2767772 RepID=UPI00195052C3
MNVSNFFRPQRGQLALPLAIFLHAFYVAPLIVLITTSFQGANGLGLSLGHYLEFFRDSGYVQVLVDTFFLGLQVTIACLVFGYPVAYFYTYSPAKWKGILTFLIMLPLLTSAVVRTFGWVVILGRQGLINGALMGLGIIDEPIKLLFTHQGVVMAMTQIWLPMMVLPIVASMSQIDPHLTSASKSLGGGLWRTFWEVTFPLTLPGLISGCLLVFALTVSSFVTPSIIGGGQLMYMPTLIYQQGVVLLNKPFAAAVSAILLAMVLLVVFGFSSFGRRTQRYVK